MSESVSILKTIVHILTFFVITMTVNNQSTVHAQEEREHYISKILFDLKWGSKPEEVGFLDNLAGYEGIHAGPNAFDVDESGAIYLLDSVNNAIKKFDQKGTLLHCIAVDDAGRECGTIALDEKGSIWHFNTQGRFLRTYSGNGTLLQTIEYDKHYPTIQGFNLTIRDGEILGAGNAVEIKGLAPHTGRNGEPIFNAVIKKTETNRIATGIISKRIYTYICHLLIQGENIPRSRIEITEENGSKYEFFLKGMDPLYCVSFLREDINGNVYFFCFDPDFKKLPQIWKYTSSLEFVTKVDNLPDLPYPKRFMVEKWIVIDRLGTIYAMNIRESGVQFMKWYVEND